MSTPKTNTRLKPDQLLVDIARYVERTNVGGRTARRMARYCLMDALGCALQSLDTPDCLKLLGPLVPGTLVPNGARVPGTQFELDPVTAAFNLSCLVRWHDFSDTWQNGGHPSDNLGGILATADYLSRARIAAGRKPLLMRDVITALIKAYEVQGVLSEGNTFNRAEIGLDSVVVVKIATVAIVTQMLGGKYNEIINAVSNAVVDGHALTIYRKMPHAGSRKSWAGADATSRAVRLAFMSVRGEMGYPHAFTAKTWGFQDVLYRGNALRLPRRLASYVMENIQFKISYPAERHGQTAAECAVRLHPFVKHRLDEIEKIELHTHDHTLRTFCVSGPLPNYAARDHCLQYIAAVGLLDGDITTASYEDAHAANPRIDELRAKMVVSEDQRYTRDYRSATKHSNANSIQVFFKDGAKTRKVEIEYPVGDPSRRREGLPLLEQKFRANLARRFPAQQQAIVMRLFSDHRALEERPVNEFMSLLMI